MGAGWIAALALLVQTIGAATFPDDPVRWVMVDPVTYDQAAGVIVYGAVPSADVGCRAPRFTVDVQTGVVLALHCQDERGAYRLHATAGGL